MGKAGEKWKQDFPDIPNPDRSFRVKKTEMKDSQAKLEAAYAVRSPVTPNVNKRFSMVMRFHLDDAELKGE